MAIRIHNLDASKKLRRHQSQLSSVTRKAAKKSAKLLGADGINIAISPFKPGDAPSSGIGGYSFSPYRIEILLDAERADLASVIASELPAVLGHEMHHCVRSLNNPSPKTLGEYLALEGLATHFELQMNNSPFPSLFKELHKHDWMPFFEQARPLLDRKDLSFDLWFLGSDSNKLPKYLGYYIGYKAVALYQSQHSCNDLDMINITSGELFRDL